jgi:hypothetical protein
VTEHLCVVCPQLRQGDPRLYDRPNVCEGCRSRLRALLAEIPEHYAGLSLEKGSTGGAKVSGSRTPPLPLSVAALDLTMPAGHRQAVQDDLVPLYDTIQVTVPVYDRTTAERRCDCTSCDRTRAQAREAGRLDSTQRYVGVEEYTLHEVIAAQRVRRRDERGILAYGPSGDQVGDVSIAARLDSWAQDWQTYRWALLPQPTVPALATWLTERLEWACDVHPAVNDFAAELADMAAELRPLAPRAELKRGVPCRDCDRVTLYRWPGSDYVECGSCPVLMTPEEYLRWVQLISAPEHQPWVRAVVASQRTTDLREDAA